MNRPGSNGVKQITGVGLEYIIGTNYFGHVLLTEMLLKSLEVDKIVMVTCPSHLLARVIPSNLALNSNKESYNQLRQYTLSHLARMLYAKRLSQRSDVCSVIVSPGKGGAGIQK